MNRIRLHKKHKIKTINMLVVIVILIIVFTIILFNKINKKLVVNVSNYAVIESKKFANLLITESIRETSLNTDNLYIIEDNQVSFDPNILNSYLADLSKNIHDKLDDFENGNINRIDFNDRYNFNKLKKGIIYEIPLSSVLNYPLLSNIGYKIPIKLNFIGDVLTNIKTEVVNYGINNALIKLYVNVEITEEVLIPFKSETIKVCNDALLSVKIIQGNVPEYYSNGNTSDFTIPLE